jgi:hypothetical protein
MVWPRQGSERLRHTQLQPAHSSEEPRSPTPSRRIAIERCVIIMAPRRASIVWRRVGQDNALELPSAALVGLPDGFAAQHTMPTLIGGMPAAESLCHGQVGFQGLPTIFSACVGFDQRKLSVFVFFPLHGQLLVVIGAVSEPGVRGPTHVPAAFPAPLYGRRHQPTTERPLRPRLQPIFSWGPDSQLPVSREASLAGPLPLLGVMPGSTAHDVRWARCSSSAKHHFRGLFHVAAASLRRRNSTIGDTAAPVMFTTTSRQATSARRGREEGITATLARRLSPIAHMAARASVDVVSIVLDKVCCSAWPRAAISRKSATTNSRVMMVLNGFIRWASWLTSSDAVGMHIETRGTMVRFQQSNRLPH